MKKIIKIGLSAGLFFGITSIHAGDCLDRTYQKQVSLNSQAPEQVAQKAYDLKLEDQQGARVNLKDYKGKVVFINFWATWCPPCLIEMPGINELYNQYKEDNHVVFLMISLDRNFDTAKTFLSEKGFDFDIYRAEGSIPQDFQTPGIPATFVLDKEGEIAKKIIGASSYNTIEFKDFLNSLKG